MSMVEAIVVGAEPYGLSVAAHLLAANIGLQIIGQPMKCWRKHMPIGMKLKPEPLASNFFARMSALRSLSGAKPILRPSARH
jgi:hypothetical protein